MVSRVPSTPNCVLNCVLTKRIEYIESVVIMTTLFLKVRKDRSVKIALGEMGYSTNVDNSICGKKYCFVTFYNILQKTLDKIVHILQKSVDYRWKWLYITSNESIRVVKAMQ